MPASPRTPSPDDAGQESRFEPGAVLAGRYRIVGLLGRGGMGEVYRADDLTLGQSVALKFLPPSFAADPSLHRRFLNEVRTAREVAHPNICRVYDIGTFEGHTYLSMEYIDGEDLASLLRRIGRLPREKGLEIARQLCAGLGALHDRGVLHRDLKPANVMLDGRGRVRITDFGLAVDAGERHADELHAGTPAYMAPEQLSGEVGDARSDIYALGLILYELFTGHRAHAGATIADLLRERTESSPTSPSTLVDDMDPVVERVIARCLEHDPGKRPPSAFAVAAALPGGDPLAAALAAGEIPSPEMVAASGESGRLRPSIAALCVAAVVVGVLAYALVNVRQTVVHYDPIARPPQVLEDRARAIAERLGTDPPAQRAHGFATDRRLLGWLREQDATRGRWQALRAASLPAVVYWYRQSPRAMNPVSLAGRITRSDPPFNVSGEVRILLDTDGHLISYETVPPEWVAAGAGTAADSAAVSADSARVDWSALFADAGLDPTAFVPVAPEWTPYMYADRRVAWTGTLPDRSDIELRVEGAAFRGRPVDFMLIGPWTVPARMESETVTRSDRVSQLAVVAVVVVVFIGAFVLALRNVQEGVGDRRGAWRLSLFIAGISQLQWALLASHQASAADEVNNFFAGAAGSLLIAALFAAFYLALEPYVRKTWPGQIVGWSRLIAGRFTDPLIGRDILVGAVFFCGLELVTTGRILAFEAAGAPLHNLDASAWAVLLGPARLLGEFLGRIQISAFNAMFFMLSLLILRLLLRNQRVAIVAFAIILFVAVFLTASPEIRTVAALEGLVAALLFSFVLFRYGLLAFFVGFFFNHLLGDYPVTFDGSLWYQGTSMVAPALILAATLYGMRLVTRGARHVPAAGR